MQPVSRRSLNIFLILFTCLLLAASAHAQTETTGAVEGMVTDNQNKPVPGAVVLLINQETQVQLAAKADDSGRFVRFQLQPGAYTVRVSVPGFKPFEKTQGVFITQTRQVLPPIRLENEIVAAATPTPDNPPPHGLTPLPTPAGTAKVDAAKPQDTATGDESVEINATDGRRGGNYPEKEVITLPLGAATITRTFDELALFLPGVAPPPQTQGDVAGPGVGAGVGSAGQFSVNGLRSRANNFTVDGSDNNDEDIGVRRQGFLSLVPQPVESIKEYQVITLLAPAQYGRNIGAQVNAVSKSGGNNTHGSIFGFLNSSQLNARSFFDTTFGNAVSDLRVGNQRVIVAPRVATNPDGSFIFNEFRQLTPVNGRVLTVRNQSGDEDSFTLGQGGFVLGGPLVPNDSNNPNSRSLFYFVSAEGQILNATREASFAVPTVAQRGFGGTGATGITTTPLLDINGVLPVGSPNFFFPTTDGGDAVFSLFPFPNNPNGIYRENTFTQVLPASGEGKVFSGKVDGNFKVRDRQQSIVARYNFTDDYRDIPVTGGALFSSLRPNVRTQNISTFLNSEVTNSISNQLRASYGRTRLNFEELRDTNFLLPAGLGLTNPEERRFLLNAPVLGNFTLPNSANFPNSVAPNTGQVIFINQGATTEGTLGPVGQVIIAGFSPVGTDVFNFPQRRVNNTYQLADTLNVRASRHSFAFGTDIRRAELNSELPRNSRPLITFNGAPRLLLSADGTVRFATNSDRGGRFFSGVDLAAASASSGFFQTLSTTGNSSINLRYYQYYFFGQDEWRVRPNLSLSYGLRYEYTTPAREINRLVERTFNDPLLDRVPSLRSFIANRTGIFDPDRNNLAPRVGLAYSPAWFGPNRTTVIRAGYGLFYDQVIGSVVSQSRNVYPTNLTANFAAGGFTDEGFLTFFNPSILAEPGTLNRVNRLFATGPLIDLINAITGREPGNAGILGATLPARRLKTPMAHHYSLTVEQQLGQNTVASAAYVGTLGRNLLRVTTPNLGLNEFILPLAIDALNAVTPELRGFAFQPGTRISAQGDVIGGRPRRDIGAINIYETSANSRYDALQLQLRGRFARGLQYQANYTFSRAEDDVSDVFDVAGASALPQNSLTRAGERADSNFDARHRFAYNLVYTLPRFNDRGRAFRAVFGGVELASTGQFQTGQPFTVNSIFDVNLDGNLTDRLNSTSGITRTGDRQRPLALQTGIDPATLLAPIGQDGSIPRNSFRGSNLLLLNLALIKHFRFSESKTLTFRTEIFNLTNRANFGIPVRFLESPGFGQATDTVTPGRRVQFALKLTF